MGRTINRFSHSTLPKSLNWGIATPLDTLGSQLVDYRHFVAQRRNLYQSERIALNNSKRSPCVAEKVVYAMTCGDGTRS
ncbi:MAG: hypothetical protein AAFN93_25980 [Bacteroidota bacterium]